MELEKLKQKLHTWRGSRKTVKFVDLCFKLGKAYVDSNDRKNGLNVYEQGAWYSVKNEDTFFKNLFVSGIDAAENLNLKLQYDQMIEYGVLLLKPQGDKSITQALNRGDERDKKALNWFLACYEEMKKRNFREKQKIACEAYIGISYFKCQNHKKAYEYFIRNFEYKIPM